MFSSKRTLAVGCIMGLACAANVSASEINLAGFVRAGGAMSTGEESYLGRIDKNGDTGDSHFGLTASSSINQHWDVAGQIFSSAKEGSAVVLDWAYGTFRPVEGVRFSMGRIKYPNLLVSEYYDIGVSYLWVRPPQELYSMSSEGVHLSMEAFNGATVAYEGAAGSLEYTLQVFGGDAKDEEGKMDKLIGGKVRLGSEMFSIQAGYNQHSDVRATESNDISVMSVGATVEVANLVLNTEYAQGTVAENDSLKTTAYYVTMGYHIGNLTPHITYSTLDSIESRDVTTLGVKYQIAPPATFKLDVAHVAPKAETGSAPDAYQVVSAVVDFVF